MTIQQENIKKLKKDKKRVEKLLGCLGIIADLQPPSGDTSNSIQMIIEQDKYYYDLQVQYTLRP